MKPLFIFVIDLVFYTSAFATANAAFGFTAGALAFAASVGYSLICYVDGMTA